MKIFVKSVFFFFFSKKIAFQQLYPRLDCGIILILTELSLELFKIVKLKVYNTQAYTFYGYAVCLSHAAVSTARVIMSAKAVSAKRR